MLGTALGEAVTCSYSDMIALDAEGEVGETSTRAGDE
jgi:hypothetical protein